LVAPHGEPCEMICVFYAIFWLKPKIALLE